MPSVKNYAVGTVRIAMDVAEGRRLPVQLWYPALDSARGEAEAGRPVAEFEPGGPERELLDELVADASDSYTPRPMHAADAPAALASDQPFPLVLISHCTDCLRYGYYSIAEELAARGFVVAAPDHVKNTLYDQMNGTSVGLELDDFLETRRLDMSAVLDTLLDDHAVAVPSDLRGRLDPQRVGMAGHSFGALTTAYASTRDSRIRAVVFLHMLAEQEGTNLPYVGDQLAMRVHLEPLTKPALFTLGTEDVIEWIGLSDMIRENYENYPAETYLATLRDAGHYSPFDLCGIVAEMADGCGPGLRPTQLGAPFTFLDIETSTSLTAALVASFFEQQLLGEHAQTLESIAEEAPSILTVEHRHPQ